MKIKTDNNNYFFCVECDLKLDKMPECLSRKERRKLTGIDFIICFACGHNYVNIIKRGESEIFDIGNPIYESKEKLTNKFCQIMDDNIEELEKAGFDPNSLSEYEE